jgi:threonine aldolase
LDGARLFNAIVAQNIRELDAVAGFDSVSICLSKGLGAPAGSVLLGSREIIDAARRWRKALGGAMRQSGILAAAGLYALDHHVARLADDHANAAFLAAGLSDLGLRVSTPQTNIVYVDVPARLVDPLTQHLLQQGIRASIGPRTRLVTHLDVTRAHVIAVLQAFRAYPDWPRSDGSPAAFT